MMNDNDRGGHLKDLNVMAKADLQKVLNPSGSAKLELRSFCECNFGSDKQFPKKQLFLYPLQKEISLYFDIWSVDRKMYFIKENYQD